jgi:hypothetical protein
MVLITYTQSQNVVKLGKSEMKAGLGFRGEVTKDGTLLTWVVVHGQWSLLLK